MKRYILNDSLVAKPEAKIAVSDLALLRGYGIFDFFRLEGLKPLFLEDHLDRFFRSAARLRLPSPVAREGLRSLVLAMIRENKMKDSAVRIVLTGGDSSDGYSIGAPTLIGINEPVARPAHTYLENGIKVMPCAYVRDIPDVKTLNYSMGIYMQPDIAAVGASDVLYHFQGQVSELSRSNFYIVTQSGTIVTPDKNILPGITRKKILQIAQQEFDVEERTLYLDEVYAASECFISGTTKTVMPVTQVGDHTIGTGKPGKCTRKLQGQFAEFVQQAIKDQ
jgi:branched-subunit amino acid aminotransferase/4-amino-4-deoxychorismate lyase